ncbi:hypothetical protein KAU33_06515, partial [Candidatus Dependentiae bacterium]|nr:hypothetical protein [Candidatus Dependentiae bacterium]
MKKSRYNHFLGEFNNKHIYYNGLSKQTIEFNDEENNLYNEGKFNDIESLYPQTFDSLKKFGYLYPDNLDQRILIKQYLNSMEKNSHYLKVTFLLSRACNFDCIYCFQQNDISNEHLTRRTADKYIDYIKNQL